MASELVPADDEVFRINDFIDLKAYDNLSQNIYPAVWVGKTPTVVNLDISYDRNDAVRSIDIYMSPEDAERIGILLQFAAREVMDRRDGND